jgi:hypothetical protein
VRKYPAASCTKSQTSFEVQKSQVNGVREKYRLVVALQDVSSYLHNGTLTSIDQASDSGKASLYFFKRLPEHGIMYLVYRKLVQVKWLHTIVKQLELFQSF